VLKTKKLQRIVKGFANHRRIQILELLEGYPEISLTEIASRLKVNFKTVGEHTRRLSHAGLILKRYKGAEVLHAVSPVGDVILKFLRTLE
jgi:Mn-dependent DtxR family transcriptional regulator